MIFFCCCSELELALLEVWDEEDSLSLEDEESSEPLDEELPLLLLSELEPELDSVELFSTFFFVGSVLDIFTVVNCLDLYLARGSIDRCCSYPHYTF